MARREKIAPIVGLPSKHWRDLVFAEVPGWIGTPIGSIVEDTWLRAEVAASTILNLRPGADNYSNVTPQAILDTTGLSRASFYGHRRGVPKRGIMTVGRLVASITVRELADQISEVNNSLQEPGSDQLTGIYLTSYLERLLGFANNHPEDARGFLRAMYSEVAGRECDARVKQSPKHPALIVIDPVAKMMAMTGISTIGADSQHLVRRVIDTGVGAGLDQAEVTLDDVRGLDRLIG